MISIRYRLKFNFNTLGSTFLLIKWVCSNSFTCLNFNSSVALVVTDLSFRSIEILSPLKSYRLPISLKQLARGRFPHHAGTGSPKDLGTKIIEAAKKAKIDKLLLERKEYDIFIQSITLCIRFDTNFIGLSI